MLHAVLTFLAVFPHNLYQGNILLAQSLCSLDFHWASLVSRVSVWMQSCHHGPSTVVVLLLSFPLSSCPASSCSLCLPLCKKAFSTVGSKPLACKHLSGSTNAGTLAVQAYIFESFDLPYIYYNQVVTTTLPFSKSLDD